MVRFVLSRALKAVLTIWIAITSTFFLLRLLPGDPTTLMVEGDMTPEMQAALLKTYGLDRPLWEQYVSYLRELVQGNLGISFRQIQPVTDIILDRLPWTLLLAGTAFVLTIAVGIPIGVAAAVNRGRWLDRALQGFGISANALSCRASPSCCWSSSAPGSAGSRSVGPSTRTPAARRPT